MDARTPERLKLREALLSVVRLDSIRKRFGPVQALNGVSFALERGEIHALLGENGAGKSTLMNVLYGLIRPDSGSLFVEERPVEFRSPRDSIRAGIGMVHQHFMLVPNLTVAENLFLGDRERFPFRFDRRAAVETAKRLSEEFRLNVPVGRTVGELPVGVQQRVEILKCLARDARALILDEPTAVLTPQEVEELNDILLRLRDSGRSIIFISHKLKEVLAVCDRVTVLRRGENAGTISVSDVDETSLSELMVGRALAGLKPRSASPREAPVVLELDGLAATDDRGGRTLDGVNLVVGAGEIVGIAGIDGNGQTELVETLAGVRTPIEGRILLNGERMNALSPRERAARGLALITEDRRRKGLILELSIAENLALKRFREPPFSRGGWLNRAAFDRSAQDAIAAHAIHAEGPEVPVGTLSGGNQQKVVFARELALKGALLVAANPTRGIDVGAMERAHQALLDARAAGSAILLVSTELDEILALSDRIAVLVRGRLHELPPDRADRTNIGRLMLGKGDAA